MARAYSDLAWSMIASLSSPSLKTDWTRSRWFFALAHSPRAASTRLVATICLFAVMLL